MEDTVNGKRQEIVLKAAEEENRFTFESVTIQGQKMVEQIVPQLVPIVRQENATYNNVQVCHFS